jgi:toxin ParE1/3/4
MTGRPLEFHPQAEMEYLAALAWYQQRSSTAALRFESALAQAISTIRDAPHRWPTYLAGCRRYTLHQFPFIVVYSTLATHTVVLAIAHGHRRPGYWIDRVGFLQK